MFKNSPKVVFVDAGFTITRGVPVTEKIDYLLKNWLTIKRPANESLMNNLFAELLDRRATGCEWKDSSYNIVTAENPDDETAAVLRLLGMTNGSDPLLMGISSGRLGLQTDHERQKQMPPKSLEDLLSHTRMFLQEIPYWDIHTSTHGFTIADFIERYLTGQIVDGAEQVKEFQVSQQPDGDVNRFYIYWK